MQIDECNILELPKILDDRGNLSFMESNNQVPFDVKRVYWIYDVPGGQQRGGHAFKEQEEVIIALSGSFDIVVKDKGQEMRFSLNRSYNGLYVPNGIWRHLENFSTNSLCLILASTDYDVNDYIRDFNEYLKS